MLEQVRELVRRDIYPLRNRLAMLGLAHVFFNNGRLSERERLEGLILAERLLAENAKLIELLGIDRYVWGRSREADGIAQTDECVCSAPITHLARETPTRGRRR